MRICQQVVAPASGVRSSYEWSYLVTARGGRIARVEFFIDRDEDLARALEADNAEDFARLTRRLVTLVNDMGERLPRDDVRASDLIVPAADMTVAEAKTLLGPGGSGPAS